MWSTVDRIEAESRMFSATVDQISIVQHTVPCKDLKKPRKFMVSLLTLLQADNFWILVEWTNYFQKIYEIEGMFILVN